MSKNKCGLPGCTNDSDIAYTFTDAITKMQMIVYVCKSCEGYLQFIIAKPDDIPDDLPCQCPSCTSQDIIPDAD